MASVVIEYPNSSLYSFAGIFGYALSPFLGENVFTTSGMKGKLVRWELIILEVINFYWPSQDIYEFFPKIPHWKKV
tara:strand:- start:79 stop:306 length:228 start_codon:yes stop_codon:yes gene_type:complete